MRVVMAMVGRGLMVVVVVGRVHAQPSPPSFTEPHLLLLLLLPSIRRPSLVLLLLLLIAWLLRREVRRHWARRLVLLLRQRLLRVLLQMAVPFLLQPRRTSAPRRPLSHLHGRHHTR
jgi:hypothetical protein